jgi:hypothetical protein
VLTEANASGLPLGPNHRDASPNGGLPNAYVLVVAVPNGPEPTRARDHPNSDSPKSKRNLVQAMGDVSLQEHEVAQHVQLLQPGRLLQVRPK